MYLADYHLHSTCSPDARDSMEDMIAAARAAGLDEICFTEHVEPLVWATTQPRGDYDWAPLSAAFAAAKEAAGDSDPGAAGHRAGRRSLELRMV